MDQSPSGFAKGKLVAVALLCLACPAAGEDVLYRWTGPDGVVGFSNVPPDKSRGDERLQAPDGRLPGAGPLAEQDPLAEETLRAVDAVQQASAQVDLAECALAMARRPIWTTLDPGHLAVTRMARTDRERIAFYQRNFIVARKMLLEVLQQNRGAAVRGELTASVAK